MKVVIDRFEGDYAVCEIADGTCADIPIVFLNGAKEGDIINIEIDKGQTDVKKKNAMARFNGLKTNVPM